MGADVGPSRPVRAAAAISVDKVDKQPAACVSSRLCMDDPGMVARLGFFWVGLEWPWRRITRELASYSNCRVYRYRRVIVHGRVRQRHRADNGETSDSRGTRARNAAALRSHAHDGCNCRRPNFWRARRPDFAVNKTTPGCCRAGEYSAKPKVRSTVYEKNIRPVCAIE